MANTYTLISSVTVGSGGAASMAFSSIPSTYTDLQVLLSIRDTGTNGTGIIQFNSDTTAANYSYRVVYGSGSTAQSGSSSNPWFYNETISTDTANTFASGSIYIPNYTGSNKKSVSIDVVTENNATLAYTNLYAGLWQGTAAITGITFTPFSGNWTQYSTAYLYGISNA